jgi:hypothetical protein
MLSDAEIKQKTIDIGSSSFIDDVGDNDKIYIKKPKQQPRKQVAKQRIIEEDDEDIIEFEDDYKEVIIKRPIKRSKNIKVVKENPQERLKKQQVVEEYEEVIVKRPKKQQTNNRNIK